MYLIEMVEGVRCEHAGRSKEVQVSWPMGEIRLGRYCPFARLESAFSGISGEAGGGPSGIPHNCTPCAHAIISPPLEVSPRGEECTRDGRRLSSDTPASERGLYDGVSAFGMLTSRQMSASRPESGCTESSTALRSLTEDNDEERECRGGSVYFSLRGGLKEVGGDTGTQKGSRRRGESGGRTGVEGAWSLVGRASDCVRVLERRGAG